MCLRRRRARSLGGAIDLDGAAFIVKVEERKAAGMKSIADVRDEVEQMLKNLEKERLRKRWIAKLRKKSLRGVLLTAGPQWSRRHDDPGSDVG